jgi:hypothetical protein
MEIPGRCYILSPEEIVMTEMHDAVSLLEAICSRRYTAVAVARTFCRQAIIAHRVTCCLTQWFFEETIDQVQRARYLFQMRMGNLLAPFVDYESALRVTSKLSEHLLPKAVLPA